MTTESINAARDPEREMLELAAKACGLAYSLDEGRIRVEGSGFTGHTPNFYYWNPRRDSGQALELAVQLGLVIEIGYAARGFLVVRTNTDNWQEFREAWGSDPNAATRLAIVRAAAEIGKALP